MPKLSKHRIAILIALMFAMPAGVVALEEAAPSHVAESVELQVDTAVTDAQPAKAADTAAQTIAKTNIAVIETVSPGAIVWVQPSDPYPKGSEVEWEISPALAQYFEEMERIRGPLVARGDVFPKGGDIEWELTSTVVAYFDQLEQQRTASAQPATQTSSVPAAPSRNPLRAAVDYVTGIFKPNSAAQ